MEQAAPARHALVVEDDADIRSLLVHTLRKEGFTVAEAPNGPRAVELVQSVNPELVTLDVQLPGADGLEVCRALREHSSAYVVMISARATEADKLAGLEAGADDYMTKPFSTRELRARVDALFRRSRMVGAAPTGLSAESGEEAANEDSDRKRAVEVQRGLLPDTPPEIGGYDVAAAFQPSRLVGGDLYDWYVEAGQLHLTLADAMGKGMGAAMIAASVRATFRSVRSMPGLTSAFNHAAEALTSALESSGSYATVFTMRMNPSSGRLSYVDAGHGIAGIVSAEGQSRHLSPGGTPVGLWNEEQWTAQREDLNHGETLILVSDGVLDAVGGLEETLAAMAEIVRANDTAQGIADDLARLAEHDPEHDDVTAVVVQRHRKLRTISGSDLS